MKRISVLEEAFAFQLRATGLDAGMEREYRFHPRRRWRFDFAWPDLKVAVEVEGGVWQYGRHNRARGFLADLEKYNEAAVMGWLVLRVAREHVENGQALEWLEKALESRKTLDKTGQMRIIGNEQENPTKEAKDVAEDLGRTVAGMERRRFPMEWIQCA